MKLLVVSPTCDGGDIGEAWVSYQWVTRLAEKFDVTLLTYHKRGKTPASAQLSGIRVVEWQELPFVGRSERLNSMLKPSYFAFYILARRWVRSALANGETFDIAHQPLPVAMRYPSPLVGLGIPYVIGPVGGSLDSPIDFARDEGTTPWFVGLRRFDRARLLHDRALRATYEQANCVLGIAPYVRENLAGLDVKRFEVMSETALTGLPEAVHRVQHEGPVRLLTVGRLVRTKGARTSSGRSPWSAI